MGRRTTNVPSAILVSDMHLREVAPTQRTDDYLVAQTKKLHFLARLAEKYQVPVIDGGDVFHGWRSSPFLLRYAIENIPFLYTVPGNHDLPMHNIGAYKKSSLSVLQAAARVEICGAESICLPDFDLYGCAWGQDIPEPELHEVRNVLVIHAEVYKGKSEVWQESYLEGMQLLKRFPKYDLIVAGHNHDPFVCEYKGRVLVSPGSMMRMSISQADMKPRVYLWYALENTVKEVFFPIEDDVFGDTSQKAKEVDVRLDAFLKRLSDDIEVDLSYKKNMERYITKNKISRDVAAVIWSAMDGGNV